MMNLRPDENVLVGKWIVVDGVVCGNETCKRIENLVAGCLEEVPIADGAWARLFVDRRDGRYWELTYSDSDWHGGGRQR
jgi:hypothetical protein